MELELKKLVKIWGEVIIAIMFYYHLNQDGFMKYVVAVVLSVFLLFLGRKKRFPIESMVVFLPVVCYVLIGSITCLIAGNITTFWIKEFIFILLPPVVALAGNIYFQDNLERFIELQFLASIVVYILIGYPALLRLVKVESTFAFVFGLFLLYYIYKQQWGKVIVASVMMLLANKRIATLAAVLGIVIILCFRLVGHKRKVTGIAWLCGILVTYVYVYSIFSGYMEDIALLLDINTSGRLTVYRQICLASEFSLSYIGSGMGSVLSLLDQLNIVYFSNLHNDLLVFYIELGFLGLFLFLSSYFAFFLIKDSVLDNRGLSQVIVLMIYSLILFMTDNVFIYILYLVPLYSMCFAMFGKEA